MACEPMMRANYLSPTNQRYLKTWEHHLHAILDITWAGEACTCCCLVKRIPFPEQEAIQGPV